MIKNNHRKKKKTIPTTSPGQYFCPDAFWAAAAILLALSAFYMDNVCISVKNEASLGHNTAVHYNIKAFELNLSTLIVFGLLLQTLLSNKEQIMSSCAGSERRTNAAETSDVVLIYFPNMSVASGSTLARV